MPHLPFTICNIAGLRAYCTFSGFDYRMDALSGPFRSGQDCAVMARRPITLHPGARCNLARGITARRDRSHKGQRVVPLIYGIVRRNMLLCTITG